MREPDDSKSGLVNPGKNVDPNLRSQFAIHATWHADRGSQLLAGSFRNSVENRTVAVISRFNQSLHANLVNRRRGHLATRLDGEYTATAAAGINEVITNLNVNPVHDRGPDLRTHFDAIHHRDQREGLAS